MSGTRVRREGIQDSLQEANMTPEEITKLTKYFHRIFKQPEIQLRQRPQKDDSCEVYVSEEFICVVFRDDEDPDDLSYNFSMAILDYDLE